MFRIVVVTMMLWVAGPGIALAQRVHHDELSLAEPPIQFLRVATDEEATARLLTEGCARSRTFNALVEQIQRSNVIVYVFRWFDLPTGGGHLAVQAQANGERAVFIFVSPELSGVSAIAAIAQQLQHAIEVAHAPEVVDHASLRRFYERLGAPSGPIPYDTSGAREMGAVVLSELRAFPAIDADGSMPESRPDDDVENVEGP